MSQISHDLQQKEAFLLKGSMQTMTIMHLQCTDDQNIDSHLRYLSSQTPKFFNNLPVLLDLSAVAKDDELIDFDQLTATLKKYQLILLGVRNGTATQHTAAIDASIGILPARKTTPAHTDSALVSGKKKSFASTQIITQPIRSGQQIHAKDADLVILNNVSEGAELLADGSIHIYGTLRGRALAGLSGNRQACIFCQDLQAELVAIAGHYRVNEQIDLPPSTHGYQVYLKNDTVCFAKL